MKVDARMDSSGAAVIVLQGYIDREAVHKLDQTIVNLLAAGHNQLVVNCEKLGYISSDGMGVFLSHLIRIRRENGDIKFAAMNNDVATVVDVLGLSNLLQVMSSEAEALAEFERESASRGVQEPAPDKLTIETLDVDERLRVLRLAGFVDRQTLASLDRALAQALADGRAQIVINCEGVRYMSSNGMGAFIGYLQKARSQDGDIRFCAMADAARTVFSVLGLQNIFQIIGAEEEAIASFEG